ncbi:hypothetical protein DsansV1_C06g0062891 [Dioscorea sansibarensis]
MHTVVGDVIHLSFWIGVPFTARSTTHIPACRILAILIMERASCYSRLLWLNT